MAITIHYEPAESRGSLNLERYEFEGCETQQAIDERLQQLVDDDANRNMACHADDGSVERIMEWLAEC